MSAKNIFTKIYENHYWTCEENRSGIGSSQYNVEIIQQRLIWLIKQFNIQTILDAPCGMCDVFKNLTLDSVS